MGQPDLTLLQPHRMVLVYWTDPHADGDEAFETTIRKRLGWGNLGVVCYLEEDRVTLQNAFSIGDHGEARGSFTTIYFSLIDKVIDLGPAPQ